jgi:hypothetical protein
MSNLDRVCQRFGVSKGALYGRFKRFFIRPATLAGIVCEVDGKFSDVADKAFQNVLRRLLDSDATKQRFYGLLTWLIRDELARAREANQPVKVEPKPKVNAFGEAQKTGNPFEMIARNNESTPTQR